MSPYPIRQKNILTAPPGSAPPARFLSAASRNPQGDGRHRGQTPSGWQLNDHRRHPPGTAVTTPSRRLRNVRLTTRSPSMPTCTKLRVSCARRPLQTPWRNREKHSRSPSLSPPRAVALWKSPGAGRCGARPAVARARDEDLGVSGSLMSASPRKGYGALYIEMKRQKGGVVSSNQKTWIKRLNDAGTRRWYAWLATGAGHDHGLFGGGCMTFGMSTTDWMELQAYRATGLTPESVQEMVSFRTRRMMIGGRNDGKPVCGMWR